MKLSSIKKYTFKKLLAAIMIVVLFVPYCESQLILGDTQSDLNDAKNQQNENNKKIDEAKKTIEKLKAEGADLAAVIEELDAQMATLNKDLSDLEDKIKDQEFKIEENEKRLEEAELVRQEQYNAMKLRIQFMYEHNDSTYLEMLLEATSMGDLLNKVEYINKISEYDRDMLKNYDKKIKEIQTMKNKLNEDYQLLISMQNSLNDQVAALELIQNEKNAQMQAITANKNKQESYLKQLEQENQKLENNIKALMDRIAEEERNSSGGGSSAGGNTSYDGGQFKWPTINTIITSPYGDMEDRGTPHKGVDIAPTRWRVAGDPIYAAYDGRVVISTFSVTAGNYIMVYHGNGLYTRYLHASSLLVSVGDYVSKGQRIALMGTTGNSTGVHLHFDVLLNGTYVNPMPYFN